MVARRKHVFARVSRSNGERITDWHNIRFDGFTKALNAGLGQCVFELGVAFDYDSHDLRVGNDVEIIVSDGDTTGPGHDGGGTRIVYKGYISLIERVVDSSTEKAIVHLLGYYTLLALDVLKNSTQTTLYSAAAGLTTASGSQAAADVGLIMRAVIDRYRAENTDPKLFYNGENDIPDTGVTVTYTFQRKTYRNALDSLKAMAPEGVYWYVDETGRVTFKEKPAAATHTFVFGKHFTTVRVEESLEKVRNFALVWDGDTLHNHYQDDASIATYGRRAELINDYGVANTNAADELGAKFLAEARNPSLRVICTIVDNAGGAHGYDIESIQPGDTCKFVNFSSSGLSDAFHDNMLITSVDYSLDRAIIEIEIIRSGLLDRQAKQTRDINDIASGGLGVPTTYS
jgi:hypothetical protein